MVQHKTEGRIDDVAPESPAARAGIKPGDRLVSINGKPVKDIIGYQFHQVDSRLAIEIEREEASAPLTFVVRKPEQQDLGLTFHDPTFDGIKRCNNHCPFCFVDQNAPGLRRTLDIKDDDLRYSFLYGGFITLTNLKESDWQRVNDERLSPLYVSVHATEPEMRRKLLGNPRAPEIVPQLKRLGEMGIQAHTQLVLCPNLNDGAHLDRSISDLAALYPHVETVGAVPVGLTKYRRNNHYQIKLDMRPYAPEEARIVVDQVEGWQQRLRGEIGTNFVYLSDEWYVLAGREMPPASQYEGFPQLENGVGMLRQLLDESRRVARKVMPVLEKPVRATIVCGEMAAPYLAAALQPLRAVANLDLDQIVVKNDTLGGNVSCSGLLFGDEVVHAIREHEEVSGVRADLIFLPRRMFDFSGVRTLDEWTFNKFQEELGRPVIAAEWVREVWSTVQKAAQGEDCYTRPPEVLKHSQLG